MVSHIKLHTQKVVQYSKTKLGLKKSSLISMFCPHSFSLIKTGNSSLTESYNRGWGRGGRKEINRIHKNFGNSNWFVFWFYFEVNV